RHSAARSRHAGGRILPIDLSMAARAGLVAYFRIVRRGRRDHRKQHKQKAQHWNSVISHWSHKMKSNLTRRAILQATGGFAGAPFLLASKKKTDIRIENISSSYEDYLYRTPIKFGGSVVDRATLLNVNCTVRTAGGQVAKGFGSM